jgi:hypothetical protein
MGALGLLDTSGAREKPLAFAPGRSLMLQVAHHLIQPLLLLRCAALVSAEIL